MPETITSRGEPPSRARALQVLVAGANLWFVAAGFPWLFIERPTLPQSVLHFAPLGLVVFGAAILGWTPAPARLRARTRYLLVAAVPLAAGLATVVRGEEINRLALPGWALVLAVLSLWVFVGVLGIDIKLGPPPSTPSPRPTAEGRAPSPLRWIQLVMLTAAAATITLAPRWKTPDEADGATGEALLAGSVLATAAAIALAIGMLLIVLGPAASRASQPSDPSLRQRLLPPLLLATIGGVIYWLTASGTLLGGVPLGR